MLKYTDESYESNLSKVMKAIRAQRLDQKKKNLPVIYERKEDIDGYKSVNQKSILGKY